MEKLISTILVIVMAFITGCASIINGPDQTIVIDTVDDIGKTYCTATNDEGTYRASAGAGMRVGRSFDDLVVTCENRDQTATTIIESDNQWWYYPINFFLWDLCLISCVVDTANGSIFTYPQRTTLMMDYKPSHIDARYHDGR